MVNVQVRKQKTLSQKLIVIGTDFCFSTLSFCGFPGYLATDAQEFADGLRTVLWLPDAAYREIAENARAAACDKFSEMEFREAMLRSLRRLVDV